MNGLASVLLAEDDETDVFLLQRAFRQVELANPVLIVPDGLACIEKLAHAKADPEQKLPALVILDLKMPRRNGLQVLEWMRSEPVLRAIPVVVFSSSANQNDIESAYDAGASGFLIKPPSTAERLDVAGFIKHWLRLVQPPLAACENFKAAVRHRAARSS